MTNIQLVVINSNIRLAASIKGALERTRQFAVVPFADASAALDYMRSYPQDVVIVDMGMPEIPGEELIYAIFNILPDVIVIASTSDGYLESRAVVAGAAGLLKASFTARQVANLIEEVSPYQVTRKSASTAAETSDDNDEPDAEEILTSPVFEKLLAEEPPLPSMGEGATVGDFITGMQVSDSMSLDLPAEAGDDELILDDDEDDKDTPAHKILEDVVDETLPWEAEPFDDYIGQFERDEQDSMAYVREPSFLKDGVFSDSFNEKTQPSSQDVDSWLIEEDQETATLIDGRLPNVVLNPGNDDMPSSVEDAPLAVDEALDTTDITNGDYGDKTEPEPLVTAFEGEDVNAESGQIDAVAPDAEGEEPDQTLQDGDLNEPHEDSSWDVYVEDDDEPDVVLLEPEDPQIARMAVTLTQTSLESTAESTLLTRDDELVAYAGQLTDADIAEFMQVITDAEDELEAGKSRMRFLTLSSNGLDYLVYSRRTAAEFVLSMVFAGKTPLKDIRQQGKRIAGALESVPELHPEIVTEQDDESVLEESSDASSRGQLQVAPGVDVDALIKHTFVWLLRDPYKTLSHPTAEAIESGLRVQLVESGWYIDLVDVEEDYVYLVARVPVEDSPEMIVRSLQERAGRIAKAKDSGLDLETLWADSYFVLTPGRDLALEEIQQYINFYRM